MNLSFFLSFCSHSNSSTSLHVCLARKSFSNCSTTATRSIVEPDESFVRHLLRLVCANCAAVVVVICCWCRHLLLSESGRSEEKEREVDRERMRACSKQLLDHCYCCCCCIREISEYPVDGRGEQQGSNMWPCNGNGCENS